MDLCIVVLSVCLLVHAQITTADLTSSTTITEQDQITNIKENYKQLAKELIFNLKGEPTQSVPEKAFVPRAMLEEYIKRRESVRNIIPDDRDFYGKIDLDDSFSNHEEFWNKIHEKYGGYDVPVELGPRSTDTTSYRYRGEASHIGHIPLGTSDNIPKNIEHILPPHSRNKRSSRQFQSAHMHFNLSQSQSYQTENAIDDLRGAELYLSRVSLGKELNQYNPRYQRIYLLNVHGYDRFEEPTTSIFESKLIKTSESTPIVFNIYPIIKAWMMNPDTNMGIIVRVTDDDPGYNQTTAEVHEHVRLKRQFRFQSEDQHNWEKNQPYILIYSKSSDTRRRHVKRNHDESENQPRRVSTGRPSSSSRAGQPRSRGKGKQSSRCGRRTLNIDFDEVGWSSWIIAPKSYNANYCTGDCSWPLVDNQNATNHAIIQAIYSSVGRNVAKTCCAPVKLARMAILYQLDGIVQMREYDDMIVESCGCL